MRTGTVDLNRYVYWYDKQSGSIVNLLAQWSPELRIFTTGVPLLLTVLSPEGTASGFQDEGAKSESARTVIGYVPRCVPLDVPVCLLLVFYSLFTGDIPCTTAP